MIYLALRKAKWQPVTGYLSNAELLQNRQDTVAHLYIPNN